MECRWLRQAQSLCRAGEQNGLHGFAGIKFIDLSRVYAPYIELQALRILVMYLDGARSDDRLTSHSTALRLARYRASVVPHGLQWGGRENSELFKDLKLMPGCGVSGERIDCRNGNLLSAAMNLRELVLHVIQRQEARPAVRLPRAWAAFRTSASRQVSGEVACY